MQFHDRFKYILAVRGITLKQVSVVTGYSYRTVLKYSQGETKPDIQFFSLLREIIPDFNLNWLSDEIGEPFLKDYPTPPKDKKKPELTAPRLQHRVTENGVTSGQLSLAINRSEEYQTIVKELRAEAEKQISNAVEQIENVVKMKLQEIEAEEPEGNNWLSVA